MFSWSVSLIRYINGTGGVTKLNNTQPGSLGRRAFVCRALWRGFDPRQQKVDFGVILVPQSNTIICKHNMTQTRRVYKLNVYMIPGCPSTTLNYMIYS